MAGRTALIGDRALKSGISNFSLSFRYGEVVYNESYAFAGAGGPWSTEQLMESNAFRFKHYTECGMEWMSETISSAINGKPETNSPCKELQDL